MVDFSPYSFELTVERMSKLEITYPFWIVPVSLLQRFPEEESRLKIQIKPFTLTVYIYIRQIHTILTATSNCIMRSRFGLVFWSLTWFSLEPWLFSSRKLGWKNPLAILHWKAWQTTRAEIETIIPFGRPSIASLNIPFQSSSDRVSANINNITFF